MDYFWVKYVPLIVKKCYAAGGRNKRINDDQLKQLGGSVHVRGKGKKYCIQKGWKKGKQER